MIDFVKNKILKRKKTIFWVFFSCLALVLIVGVDTASAQVGTIAGGTLGAAVASLIGAITSVISYIVGNILVLLIDILVNVAKFNNIINVDAVRVGWVIVRDLVNMFFVLILLVIAFATILRVENYNAKKMLPKLLIMAVLINFSKTIFGIIIDFSQVIMLTFVNGFGSVPAANLINLFNIQNYQSIGILGVAKSENINNLSVAGAFIAGMLAMIITTIVILVMLGVLIMRVVMLWIYTILSPLVFLGFAFPPIQKYVGKIWDDFIKQVVIGPLLAFFIWLALFTADKSSKALGSFGSGTGLDGQTCAGINAFFCEGRLQTYIITIGLLIGGLMVAQEMGGAAGSMAGKGMAWAKGAGKFVGGAVGYIPVQYAKRAGYGVADKTLEQIKKIPGIGSLAMKSQAKLKMKRDYAEEQDTRYMQYLSEKDLDLVIQRHRGREGTGVAARASQATAFIGRGMESGRQDFKRALTEKMKKGEEWGETKEEKMRNKTRAMIELAEAAGHSVTSSGEDTFRDAELGKLWHEYRNRNVGMIDDDEMRAYYTGGVGSSGRDYGRGLKGGDNSEYFRPGAPGMVAYTANRMRMADVFSLHHENLAPRIDADGNAHYDVLDTVYNEGRGAMKTLAQVRDRGTTQQKEEMANWIRDRIQKERTRGSGHYLDAYNNYIAANPTHTEDDFIGAAMVNGGIQGIPNASDPIGKSRVVTGESKNPAIKSGITGLDKLEKGRLALNFSEIGLDKSAAKYLEGGDKAKVAKRIGNKLKADGMAENMAEAIEDQINKASHLILYNREVGVSGMERKTAFAHESLHGRLDSTFNRNELKDVWDNKMSEDDRNKAREKVKKVWGNDKMNDDAVMHEYFAEGLTNKTRWREKNPEKRVILDSKAEHALDDLLKSKGSNIQAFTSNLHTERPTQENIKQSISSGVDSSLKSTMEELTGAIHGMGSGLSSLEGVVGSMDNLDKSVRKNYMTLEKSAKSYKDVSSKLNNLSNSASAGKDVSGRDVSSKLDNLSKSVSYGLKNSGKNVSSKLNKLSKDVSSNKDNSSKLDNLLDNENSEDIS